MNYKDIYKRNLDTNRIIIDVALDDYYDFYNEWDKAKFNIRDLNPELVSFLETCVKQIPSKELLELRLHIENDPADIKSEEEVKESFYHYYNMEIDEIKKILRRIYKIAAMSISISLFMLIFVYFAEGDMKEGLLAYTIINGFEIGGWVFMWEAFYGIGFERINEKKKIHELRRLSSADVSFVYAKE